MPPNYIPWVARTHRFPDLEHLSSTGCMISGSLFFETRPTSSPRALLSQCTQHVIF